MLGLLIQTTFRSVRTSRHSLLSFPPLTPSWASEERCRQMLPCILLLAAVITSVGARNLSTLSIPGDGRASLTHYDLPSTAIAACGCSPTSSEYPTAALNQAAFGSTISCGQQLRRGPRASHRLTIPALQLRSRVWTLLQPDPSLCISSYTAIRAARGEPHGAHGQNHGQSFGKGAGAEGAGRLSRAQVMKLTFGRLANTGQVPVRCMVQCHGNGAEQVSKPSKEALGARLERSS